MYKNKDTVMKNQFKPSKINQNAGKQTSSKEINLRTKDKN